MHAGDHPSTADAAEIVSDPPLIHWFSEAGYPPRTVLQNDDGGCRASRVRAVQVLRWREHLRNVVEESPCIAAVGAQHDRRHVGMPALPIQTPYLSDQPLGSGIASRQTQDVLFSNFYGTTRHRHDTSERKPRQGNTRRITAADKQRATANLRTLTGDPREHSRRCIGHVRPEPTRQDADCQSTTRRRAMCDGHRTRSITNTDGTARTDDRHTSHST